ncbi:MAG TPA: hypothetical protein DEO59_07870 [Balneola sp.]|nr:hypothetical protein [Balneola sp.]HBZ38386.1 hypothetical protein [Balneola sp.]
MIAEVENIALIKKQVDDTKEVITVHCTCLESLFFENNELIKTKPSPPKITFIIAKFLNTGSITYVSIVELLNLNSIVYHRTSS